MEEMFNQLWQNFHKVLLNFIRKNIFNPEDAEDILQNVFLKIHTNIHQLKDKQKVSSWLFQVTRNTVIDYFRANGKANAIPLPLMEDKSDFSEDEHEESWKQELGSFLVEMIDQLPEKYRRVSLWYELDGFSHKQIAERLGISVSGSKTRVQRSREKLKELLVCGCRAEIATAGIISDSPPPACSHLVKMGQNDLCVKRLHSS